MDPTVPPHIHTTTLTTRKALPDDSQCCGAIPTIDTITRTNTKCGYTVESGTRLNKDGDLERFREVTKPCIYHIHRN